ncbi:hypothetical protein BDV93DRAFT_527159 [Ceratobasidium sp. AG-I]|nr:hypothetical protein BDV93DRAFT_527159 [Ceratobasidium sp. AG-I]
MATTQPIPPTMPTADDSTALSHIHVLHPTHTKAPLTLAVPSGARVADLKTAISERFPGQPKPNGQRIIWKGRIVVDEEVVGDIWKPGHDTHTVHLAVHPSAWSTPPTTDEAQNVPTATAAPATPNFPFPHFGAFAGGPMHSPLLASLAPPALSPLPTPATIAKEYVMFHHTNALRVMAGQSLEPWTNRWGVDQASAAHWTFVGLTGAGHAFPPVLMELYPPQSASELGVEYSLVHIEGRPYLSLTNPGATPTAMQQHAITVLTSTLALLPYLDDLATPPPPAPPVHVTYHHYGPPNRPIRPNIQRFRRIAIAIRALIPLSFTLLRASLFIVFFPPAREPLWLVVIIGVVLYEARIILNRANEATPNPRLNANDPANPNPNNNPANPNAAPNRPPFTIRSILDTATLSGIDSEAASLDLDVPEREFRPLPSDSAETSAVRAWMAKARTFVLLFGVTLVPAAWARRREALRLREGRVKVVFGERANVVGRRVEEGEGEQREAGAEGEGEVQEVPLGDRRRGALAEGWRKEYVERVLNGIEEHVE